MPRKTPLETELSALLVREPSSGKMAAEGASKPLLDDDEEKHNHGAAGTQDNERELMKLVREAFVLDE